jgi:hypothetical protein
VLRGAREVEIDDEAGDVVMFHGSRTWHLRRNAAHAINLYLKVNDFGCDPLAEDPTTESSRDRTRAFLDNGGDVDGCTVTLSRRLDSFGRVYTRNGWEERLEATVFGEPAFGITELQADILRAVNSAVPVRQLAETLAEGGSTADQVREAARTLLERGALDLS